MKKGLASFAQPLMPKPSTRPIAGLTKTGAKWIFSRFIHVTCLALGMPVPLLELFFSASFLKKIKFLIDATKNFVSPRDVAIGIYQALKANAQGHFILGGENLKLSGFVELVAKHLQLNSIDTQFIDKASLQDLDLNEDQLAGIKEFSLADPISWAKATEAFDYNPQTSVEQMILETVQYFVDNRMLRVTGKAGSKMRSQS